MRLYAAALVLLAFTLGHPQQSPDRSTPEATVRSFLASFLDGHVFQAADCVQGAMSANALQQIQTEMTAHPIKPNDRVEITALEAKTNGDTAEVHVKVAGQGGKFTAEDDLKLKQTAGVWKIVPLSLADLQKQMKAGGKELPLSELATGLSDTSVFMKAHDAAQSVSCLSNVKQLALGAIMYTQDFDEKFAIRADNFKSSVMPYIKNEQLFHCPADKSGQVSYSFNPALQGVAMAKIASPSQTVMLYEGHHLKLDFRHDGRAVIAFADGHTKYVTEAEAAKLRWKP